MTRRAPLALRVTLGQTGKSPPNTLRFEPWTRVGEHTIVRRVGTWCGQARWQLRCPAGHYFERTSTDIQRSLRGQRGPLACRECRSQKASA